MISETTEIQSARPHEKYASLFSRSSVVAAVSVTVFYFVVSFFLIGFRTDQVVLAALFNGLYFGSRATRRFILGFSIFIVYWVVFDYMKAFPNYRFNTVHIRDLYQCEKHFFGFASNGIVVTPNEFFAAHHSAYLDVVSGCFYLCWVPVPLAFAAIMFFKNRKIFFQFSLTFFLVNFIGFVGYYLYPAAPPWYVAEYGFNFLPSTPGNTAALGRFDALTGMNIFKSIYAKSSNVFAAMPSLHASYLVIVLFYGIKARLKAWNVLFAVIMLGIWFAAVYSSHHYVLDVLAGISCAIIGVSFFQLWIKTKSGQSVLQKFIRLTSR